MEIVTTFWDRFILLLKAPALHSEMLWIVLPLVVVLLLMTIYFAKYRDEELGWNTALGNSLILIFVSADLMRTTLTYNGINYGDLILAGLLMLLGVILLFVNFTHYLPKKISYFISSPLPVNLTAYVVIAIVYSRIPVTFMTILAAVVLVTLLLGGFLLIGFVSKRWWMRVERLKATEHVEDVKKEKQILEGKKKEVKLEEKKIKKAVKKQEKEVVQKKKELKKIKKVVK